MKLVRLLLLGLMVCLPSIAKSAIISPPFYNWRNSTETSCSSLTNGTFADLCRQSTDNTLWMCGSTTCTTSSQWVEVSSGGGGGGTPGGANTDVQYNNMGSFGGSSNFVYTGGNVGVGATSPAYQIDVRNDTGADNPPSLLHFSATQNNEGGYLSSNGPNNFYLSAGASFDEFSPSAPRWYSRADSQEIVGGGPGDVPALTFYVDTVAYGNFFDPTERMRIDDTGNVLIGTTTPFTSPLGGNWGPLVVSADAANNVSGVTLQNQDNTGLEGLGFVDDTGTVNDIIAIANSGNPVGLPTGTLIMGSVGGDSNPVVIDPLNDLAIGGGGTSYTLDVENGSGNAQICLNAFDGGGGGCVTSLGGGGGSNYWTLDGSGNIYNNNYSGNVMVNTTTQTEALTVGGSIDTGDDVGFTGMFDGQSPTGYNAVSFYNLVGASFQSLSNIGNSGLLLWDDLATSMSQPNIVFLLDNSMYGQGPADALQFGQFNYPEYILANGNHGIFTDNPQSALSIGGNFAVGSDYAGTYAAPNNGEIVEGQAGFGTSSPGSGYQVDINSTEGNNIDAGDSTTQRWGIDSQGNALFGDKVLVTDGTGTSFSGFIAPAIQIVGSNAGASVGMLCQNADNTGYCSEDFADDSGSFQADFGWSNTGGPYSGGALYFETNNGYPIIFTTNPGTPDVGIDGSGDLTDIAGFINGQTNIFAASAQVTMQNDTTLGISNVGYQAYAGYADNMVGAIYQNTDCSGGAGFYTKNDSGNAQLLAISGNSCGGITGLGDDTFIGTAYNTSLSIGVDFNGGTPVNIDMDTTNMHVNTGSGGQFSVSQNSTAFTASDAMVLAFDNSSNEGFTLQNMGSGGENINFVDSTNTERANISYVGGGSPALNIGGESGQTVNLSADAATHIGELSIATGGVVTTLNNVLDDGSGNAAIFGAFQIQGNHSYGAKTAFQTSQTSPITVVSDTAPNDSNNHLYSVGVSITITSVIGAESVTPTVTYTDETGTSRTISFQPATAGATVGAYPYNPFDITVESSGPIFVNTVMTGTGSLVYNVSGEIQRKI